MWASGRRHTPPDSCLPCLYFPPLCCQRHSPARRSERRLGSEVSGAGKDRGSVGCHLCPAPKVTKRAITATAWNYFSPLEDRASNKGGRGGKRDLSGYRMRVKAPKANFWGLSLTAITTGSCPVTALCLTVPSFLIHFATGLLGRCKMLSPV